MVSPEFDNEASRSIVTQDELFFLIATDAMVAAVAEVRAQIEEPTFDTGENWPSFEETPLLEVPWGLYADTQISTITSYLKRVFNLSGETQVNKAVFLLFNNYDGQRLLHFVWWGSQSISYQDIHADEPMWAKVLKKPCQLPTTSDPEAGLAYRYPETQIRFGLKDIRTS